MEPEYCVTFPFDAREFTRATRAAFAHGSLRITRFLMAGAPLLVAIWSVVEATSTGADALSALIQSSPWLVLTAFWAFGFGPFLGLLQRWAVKRQMPSIMGQQTRAFSHAGFFYATPSLAQSFAWSAIHRVVETEEFLLVFIAPSLAHYVPKHAVPVEIEAPLRAFLERQFADRPKRLRLKPWAS